MKLNALSIMVVLLLALVSLGNVQAAVSPDYVIDKVEINDRQVSENDVNFITTDRGDSLDVEIWVRGLTTGTVENDVRVKAWIGGYEFGEVSEKTSIFKVEPNGLYRKRLSISLPDDIDADDNGNSEGYTLHVESFDGDNEVRQNFILRIAEKRHDLRIQDVIFRPGTVVNAGDMLFSTVRVENMGDNKEEDIQVRISIPEIGFLARDYVDELVPHDSNNDDEEKSDDVDLFGRIPRNAPSGEYDVKVELIYNRGHEVVSDDFRLVIEGVRGVVDTDSVVSVDATSKSVKVGDVTSYKVMIANFGDERVTYSAEVLGVSAWGSASVDPAFATINAGETGELFVRVTPSIAGEQGFTARIKADGKTIQEMNLQTSVDQAGLGDVRRGLEIGFAVLAILLVILGLIIAFTKLRSDDSEGEEPELGDDEEREAGQTYY
jgi:uncharacterized membrane protein